MKLKLDVTSSTCNPSTQAPWRLRVKTKDPVFFVLKNMHFFLELFSFLFFMQKVSQTEDFEFVSFFWIARQIFLFPSYFEIQLQYFFSVNYFEAESAPEAGVKNLYIWLKLKLIIYKLQMILCKLLAKLCKSFADDFKPIANALLQSPSA